MPVAPDTLLVVEITTKITRHCQMSPGRQNPYQPKSSGLSKTYLEFCSSVMKQTPTPSTIHHVLILPPQHISLCLFTTWKIIGYLVFSNNSSLSSPHFSEVKLWGWLPLACHFASSTKLSGSSWLPDAHIIQPLGWQAWPTCSLCPTSSRTAMRVVQHKII